MTSRIAQRRKASAQNRRRAAIADNLADRCDTLSFDLLCRLHKVDATFGLSTVLVLLEVAKHYGDGLASTQAIADGLNMTPKTVGRALKRLANGGAPPESGAGGVGLVELGQGLLHEGRRRPATTARLTAIGAKLLEGFIVGRRSYLHTGAIVSEARSAS